MLAALIAIGTMDLLILAQSRKITQSLRTQCIRLVTPAIGSSLKTPVVSTLMKLIGLITSLAVTLHIKLREKCVVPILHSNDNECELDIITKISL